MTVGGFVFVVVLVRVLDSRPVFEDENDDEEEDENFCRWRPLGLPSRDARCRAHATHLPLRTLAGGGGWYHRNRRGHLLAAHRRGLVPRGAFEQSARRRGEQCGLDAGAIAGFARR